LKQQLTNHTLLAICYCQAVHLFLNSSHARLQTQVSSVRESEFANRNFHRDFIFAIIFSAQPSALHNTSNTACASSQASSHAHLFDTVVIHKVKQPKTKLYARTQQLYSSPPRSFDAAAAVAPLAAAGAAAAVELL
jgi:hypothetical protein